MTQTRCFHACIASALLFGLAGYSGAAVDNMYVDWRVDNCLFEVGEPFYFKYGTAPSYGCNAGLVRLLLETTDGKDVLVFSTPDNPGGSRVRMTVSRQDLAGQTSDLERS